MLGLALGTSGLESRPALAAPDWAAAPTVTSVNELSFGAIAACGAGTLVVDPSGARLGTGGVVPLTTRPGTPAALKVSTPTGRRLWHVQVSPRVVLERVGKGATMVADGFTHTLAPVAAPDGTRLLTVGATLHVGADQAPGRYVGQVVVTFDYE